MGRRCGVVDCAVASQQEALGLIPLRPPIVLSHFTRLIRDNELTHYTVLPVPTPELAEKVVVGRVSSLKLVTR